jgi:tRNA threonylcarbamoyladenosine biosynthesis protein TsaE
MSTSNAQNVFNTDSEEKTVQLAVQFARRLYAEKRPVFIQLTGELGAGKTAFARGFIQEWLRLIGSQQTQELISPTYNLVRTYGPKSEIAHLDLYRLRSQDELEAIGFETYFYESPVVLVEWLENIAGFERLRPEHFYHVTLEIVQDTQHGKSSRIIVVGEKITLHSNS